MPNLVKKKFQVYKILKYDFFQNQQVEIGTDPMYEKYGTSHHAMTRLHQSNLIN